MPVTEYKVVCLTHSEAKQTKSLEFGAEKGVLQGQARRVGDSCSEPLNSQWFGGRFSKFTGGGGGLQGMWLSSDWLVVR